MFSEGDFISRDLLVPRPDRLDRLFSDNIAITLFSSLYPSAIMGIKKRTRKFAHVKRAISLRDNNLLVSDP